MSCLSSTRSHLIAGRHESCCGSADVQQQTAQSQAASSSHAASGEASGAKSKEPQRGIGNVVIPRGAHEAPPPRAVADGAQLSGQQGGHRADQDSAEPEATLPGGTATGGPTGAPPSSGNGSKEPQSGFDDVVISDEPQNTQAPRADAHGAGPHESQASPNNWNGSGAVISKEGQGIGAVVSMAEGGEAGQKTQAPLIDKADQGNDAHPEASLPASAAKHHPCQNENQALAPGAKQKKLDWSAATTGRKRKAVDGNSMPKAGSSYRQATRTPPKRQCKLKLVPT